MKKITINSILLICFNLSIYSQSGISNMSLKKSSSSSNYENCHDRYITFGVNINISEPMQKEYQSGRLYVGYEFKPFKKMPFHLESRIAFFIDQYKKDDFPLKDNYSFYWALTPTAMIVPKFLYEINDEFSFLFDNEYSLGLPSLNVKLPTDKSRKSASGKPLLSFGCNVGLRIHIEGFHVTFKIGYTTFDIYNALKNSRLLEGQKMFPHLDSHCNISVALLFPYRN